MNIAALGTAIVYAKFIFLPHKHQGEAEQAALQPGFWTAMILLVGGLFAANVVYYEAFTVENVVKPLVITAIGWLAYFLIFRRLVVKLPRVLEKFEHLIGVMSLSLILLFWMAIA